MNMHGFKVGMWLMQAGLLIMGAVQMHFVIDVPWGFQALLLGSANEVRHAYLASAPSLFLNSTTYTIV